MEKPIFNPKNFTYDEWYSLISGISGDLYDVLVAASKYKTVQRKMADAEPYVEMWTQSRLKWHPDYKE